VNGQKVPMTPTMQQKIVDQCITYGTGRDTLRCLALGTIDNPMSPNKYDIALCSSSYCIVL
jgi:Ca2+ transporting ATPase